MRHCCTKLSCGIAVLFFVFCACSRAPQARPSPPAPRPTVEITYAKATPAPPEILANETAEPQADQAASARVAHTAWIQGFKHEMSPTSASYVLKTPPTGSVSLEFPTLSPQAYVLRGTDAFLKASRITASHIRTQGKPPAPAAFPDGYSGHGVYLESSYTHPVLASYADQSVVPQIRFNPDSNSYLYAPTLLSSNGACLEIVTAYSSAVPAIWSWDWCANNPGVKTPPIVVDREFVAKYIRDLNHGIGQYTVQVTKLGDGTWVAKLYNYQSQRWDQIAQSRGTSKSESGSKGWDFFEEHADGSINQSGTFQADYCPWIQSNIFESSNIQLSYDRKTFKNVIPGLGQQLIQSDMTCANFHYRLLNPLWQWIVQT